ncbi:MAG TPA: 5'/3'-nucleotidase SurE [Albitalea sp.]|nr:5'/3'-nucleotidase SurE [Albitalea sp.]HJW11444.1 5'/3'-nucleotidase SurE [Albitalea sp.]
MHVLLTHEDGHSAPGLAALRDLLIATGMVVLTVVPRSGTGWVRQPGVDSRNPIYVIDGTAADAVRQAVHCGLAADARLVVSGIHSRPSGGPEFEGSSAAAQAALLGLVGLSISQQGSDLGWAADLAAELAALMVSRPAPPCTAIHLEVPAHRRSRMPHLRAVQLDPSGALESDELALWTQALLRTLQPRLSGSAMACTCCSGPVLPFIHSQP